LQAPSKPTWTLLGQFFIIKMRQSKCSIPNHDHQRFVMTLPTLKIHFILIYDITMPNTWQAKKKTCGNYTACCAHQTKGFSWSSDCIRNHQNNCKTITSLAFTTCPKNKSFSLNVINFVGKFKWLYTYNNKGHMLTIIFYNYFDNNWITHKVLNTFHVLVMKVKYHHQHVGFQMVVSHWKC
jgi:hypothetical protein